MEDPVAQRPGQQGVPSAAALSGRSNPYLVGGLAIGLVSIPIYLVGVVHETVSVGHPGRFTVGLQYALIIVASGSIIRSYLTGVRRLLPAFFWVFVYAAVGVPGLLQLESGVRPWPVYLPEADTNIAQLALIVGSVAYALTQRRERAEHSTVVRHGVSGQRVKLLLAAYLIAFPALLTARGGLATLFLPRLESVAAAGYESVAEGAVVVTLLRLPPPLILAALLLLRRQGDSRPFLIAIAAALTAITNNPISTNRYWLIAVITLVSLAAYDLKPTARRLALVGSVLFALFGFPLLDYWRRAEAEFGATGVEAMLTGDYDVLNNVAMGVSYTRDLGFTFGWQLVSLPLFWVPRSLWPDKPIDTGSAIAEHFNFDFTRIAGPLWAEGWISSGFLGVVAVLGIAGLLSGRIEDRWLAGDHFYVLTGSFLVGYQLILLRGSLLQATGSLVACMILVWLLCPHPSQPGVSRTGGSDRSYHRRDSDAAAGSPMGINRRLDGL